MFQDPTPENASNSVVNTSGSVNDSKIVAKAYKTFNTNGSWVQQKIAFTYPNNNTTPSYVLTTFSTNKDAGVGNKGDSLIVDDIVLIYNTRLQSLNVNGNSISNFNPNVTTYTYPTPVCAGQWPTVAGVPQSPRATASISHNPTVEEPYTIIKVTHKNQESDENVTKYYRINYTVSAPTITLTNNGSYAVCAGESVTMTASGASSYTWSNNLGSGASKTVTPTATTQYTVTGTDANGCQGTAVAYVTVRSNPEFSVNGNPAICSGTSTTLTGSNSALTYNWMSADGAPIATNVSSVNISAPGSYSVEGTDNYGCKTTKNITVASIETPQVSIMGDNFICNGDTLILTANCGDFAGTAMPSYQWQDGSTQSTIKITTGGTYSVTATYSGCSSSASITVENRTKPTLTVTYPEVICIPDTATITVSSNIPNTVYYWPNQSQGTSYKVAEAGDYFVHATANGCSTVESFTLAAASKPQAPQVSDVYNCGGGEVAISVVPDATQVLTYNWYATASSQNTLHTGETYSPSVQATTAFYVSARNDAGCSSERAMITVNIMELPAPPAVSSISLCGEGDVTLEATPSEPNMSIGWFSDAACTQQTSNIQHVAETTSFYAVGYAACASAPVQLTVTVNPVPEIPSVVNPEPICSNDNVNVTLTATAGVNGDNVRWYQQNATAYTAQGVTYQAKNISSSTTYYATTYNNTTHCESAKTPIQISKNPLPAAPSVTCEPVCAGETSTMSVPSSNLPIRWYSSDDQLLGSGETHTENLSGTTSFKATAYDNSTHCESSKTTFTAVVNQTYSGIVDIVSSCDTYEWEGETYKSTGNYTKTLQTVSGCDSVVTLQLTINDVQSTTVDTVVCDVFEWLGKTYTSSQEITETLTSAAGCDSIVTMNLTVNHSTSSAQSITLCSNQLPYEYAGQTITSAGPKTIVLENAAGCDSVITLTVTVNAQPSQPTITTANTSRCGAGSLTVNVASGTNGNSCRWYESENDEQPFQTGNSFQNNYEASTTYYVSSYNSNTACESSRIPVAITVNDIPQVPVTHDTMRCGAGEVTLSAISGDNANTCRWYQNNTTTTSLFEGYNYTRNVQATATFYVESYNANTQCRSSRVPVKAVVNAVPQISVLSQPVSCGEYSGDLSALVSSNANTYRWYETNGQFIGERSSFDVYLYETTEFMVAGYDATTGCSSQLASLLVTVNQQYDPQDIFDSVCQYTLYQNHGMNQEFDETGLHTFELSSQSSAGCDSVVTLYLYVKPQITYSFSETACDFFTWNGQTYETSGVYEQSFTASNGCDSIVTLNLTINESKYVEISAEACDSYTWNNETYEKSGVYEQTFVSADGCDSIVALDLTINYSVNATDDVTICDNELPFTYNGVTFTAEAGDFSTTEFTLSTVNGCDSIVTLNLTIHHTDDIVLYDETCAGQRYSNNGFDTTIAASGTYELVNHSQNVDGCDSVTTLVLTVNQVYSHNISRMICENGSYSFNGQTLTDEGVYVGNFTSVAGCDSIVTLTLSVGSEYRDTIVAHVCEGDSYNQYGFNVSDIVENQTLVNTAQAANGCDSTTVLQIFVHHPEHTFLKEVLCQGEVYNQNNFNFEASQPGDFELVKNLKTAFGCDSTVTLNITVNPYYSISLSVSTCQSDEPYYYEAVDKDFDVSAIGSYDTVLSYTTLEGCDSIITVTVNVLQKFETEQSIVLCDNSEQLPVEFGGQQLSVSGDYMHTFVSSIGCDSTVTLHLTVNDTKDTTIHASVCLGDTYSENGFSITPDETGVEEVSRVEQCAATGCDSTVNLILTVNPVYNLVFSEEICAGERFEGHGFDTLLDVHGTYSFVHNFTTVAGCDSTITLNLTVNQPSYVQLETTLCQGERLEVHGFDTLIAEPGVHVLTNLAQNVAGCDSTTTLTLTVHPTFSKDTVVSICDVDVPFYWNNNELYSYDETGDYEIVFSTVNNCDSIINLHLNVNESFNRDTAVTVCQGALPYIFCEGYEFEQGGTHVVSLQTASGCDSVWNIQLTIAPNTEYEEEVTVCADELPYQYKNETFTEAGSYDIEERDDDNCLTITHFVLNVNDTYEGTDEVTICEENLPLQYGDSVFTQEGVYEVHFSSINNCDSVITLALNVLPTARGTQELVVCESDFPVEYAGSTFESEGQYDVVFNRENACDSIVTLTIVKAQEYLMTETAETCDHELPYIWRGKNLNESGVYYDSLVSASGCDSVYKLQLTVNETEFVASNDIELCDGETVVWRGLQISESGVYSDTVSNENTGCRVIHTVNVVVNPTYLFNETDTVCSDELPYIWRGMSINTAGEHEYKLQTAETGCDSTYRLVLTVNQSYHASETMAVCDNDLPYLWHGMSLGESGVYHDTLQTAGGCDSTFVLNFTVNPTVYEVSRDTVCDSELPYSWRNHGYTSAGTYYDSVPNQYGCMDVYELNLVVRESSSATIYDTICQGGIYAGNGFDTVALTAGTMFLQRTLENAAGCDSTLTVMLTVSPKYEIVTEAATCENVPYLWRDGEYLTAGIYYDSLTTQTGCDSVYVLNLTINPTYDVYVSDTALREHEYVYDENFVITPADSGVFNYDIHYMTIAGCDSVVHLTLYVAYNYGIDDVKAPVFSFYPNPASAVLNIEGERMRTVEVYSITGKLVYRGDADSAERSRLNVANMPSGNYVVKVQLDDGSVVNGKIIVNRR